MFSRGAVLVLLVIWALFAANVLGWIDGVTYLVVLTGLVGYCLGWLHAAHEQTREQKGEAVAMLSHVVDQMGTVLAEEELADDERELVQLQRAQVMELLGLMDRPPLRQRLHQRLRR